MFKILERLFRLFEHRADARDLYETRHEWTIGGAGFYRDLTTPPLTRTQAIQYVKESLGMRVAMIDDDSHYILCEHEKGRKIPHADSQQ